MDRPRCRASWLPWVPVSMCCTHQCTPTITHVDLNSHIFADSVAMGEFSEGGAAGPWGPPSAGMRMSSKGREPSLLHSRVGRAADAANFSFPRDVDVTQSETISSYLCPVTYWRILMLCSASDVGSVMLSQSRGPAAGRPRLEVFIPHALRFSIVTDYPSS